MTLHPKTLFLALIALAAASLAAALFAQFAYGLKPCELCLAQRAPFIAVIALSLAGLAVLKKPALVNALAALSALTVLANAGIAFYHSGVERHWWRSIFESCALPETSHADLLSSIMATPAARCDEIAWADPIFGLSMANYNFILCSGMAVFLALWLRKSRKR